MTSRISRASPATRSISRRISRPRSAARRALAVEDHVEVARGATGRGEQRRRLGRCWVPWFTTWASICQHGTPSSVASVAGHRRPVQPRIEREPLGLPPRRQRRPGRGADRAPAAATPRCRTGRGASAGARPGDGPGSRRGRARRSRSGPTRSPRRRRRGIQDAPGRPAVEVEQEADVAELHDARPSRGSRRRAGAPGARSGSRRPGTRPPRARRPWTPPCRRRPR